MGPQLRAINVVLPHKGLVSRTGMGHVRQAQTTSHDIDAGGIHHDSVCEIVAFTTELAGPQFVTIQVIFPNECGAARGGARRA